MAGKYKADRAALREIGRSARIQAQCLEAGRRLAGAANGADPTGKYVAKGATVKAGYQNEDRAGAVVEQTHPTRARNKALIQAIHKISR